MSDFLTRLAQRQLGHVVSVEPRVPEFYAPVTAATPLPVAEEIPAEPSDSRRVARAPTLVANGNSAQTATAMISNITQGEPTGVVNPVQRLETEPGREHFLPPAMEKVRAEVARRVESKSGVAPKIDSSSPPRSKPEERDSFSARSEAPASQLFFMREVQPWLMTAEAVTPMAAPSRLESKVPSRGEVAGRGRAHADSEPPVHVTIGRIEVTAVTAAPAQKRAAIARKPAMSLDDYLARRQRGER